MQKNIEAVSTLDGIAGAAPGSWATYDKAVHKSTGRLGEADTYG